VIGYVHRTATVARGVAAGARSDRVTFVAAGVAYYAFISLIPLLLLALVVASFLGDTEVVAVFAAVGWTALRTGFRIYAAFAGSYEAYGVVVGVLLLVTFLYFGGLVLLVGAVLNAVLAGGADERTGVAPQATPQPTTLLEGTMTRDRPDDDASAEDLREDLEQLYDELDRFQQRVDDRTLHREEIERELKQYVRARNRRGKARGWGPYLVLGYGTAMTLGAFYLLPGGWAVLAMIVVWLSTLGLYALMLVVGTTLTVAGLPGRLKDRFESR
jgi:hypothetical protein